MIIIKVFNFFIYIFYKYKIININNNKLLNKMILLMERNEIE